MTNPAVPRSHASPSNPNAVPNRVYMEVPGATSVQCHALAISAVFHARSQMPKMTGAGARSLRPLWGEGFFGITWDDPYVWFQEVGIHPFTMKRLAGKIIPMWVPDPTGEMRRKNPKAKTKRSEDGRTFVLIFRKAAKQGERRKVTQKDGSVRDVPASYPGAPGRIAVREMARPHTTVGKIAGAVAQRNVGVRWRHPGLTPRSFLHHGMVQAALTAGYAPGQVYATTSRWR